MPTGQQYATGAAQENLTSSITNATTLLNVTGTTGFPATPFTIILDIGQPTQEACDVTNVAGNVLTCTRGIDGTSAQNHSNNATVTHASIGRDFREARSHMDASGTGAGTTVHGLQNGSVVVGTTDTQTLTNKTLTSPTINTLTAASATITGTVSGSATYTTITATSPTITGTVAGGASYTGITATNPAITGTVTGTATYNSPVVNNTAVGNIPLLVQAINSTTANIQEWDYNGSQVAALLGSPKQGQFTGVAFNPTGLTGATTASRYVGATAGGPPASGTFVAGDWVEDTVYGIAWVCVTGGSPGTWKQQGTATISQQTLVSNTATINFSSIPSYFKHLQIIITGQSNGTVTAGYNEVDLTWNGNTTANYNILIVTAVVGGGATPAVASIAGTNFTKIGTIWNAHLGTSGAGRIQALLPNYGETTWYKTVQAKSLSTDGGSVGVGSEYFGAFGNATIAISSLAITNSDASSFITGSQFELLGIG